MQRIMIRTAAADNAISNLAFNKTAQAQVATIQSQVSTPRTQKSDLKIQNAELEKYQQIWNLKFKNYQVKL